MREQQDELGAAGQPGRTLYDLEMEGALLALAAYPEDLSRACVESGCDTFEGFELACSLCVGRGWMEQTARGAYSVTAAGREHGAGLLAREAEHHEHGELTAREAAAVHSDLFHTDAALHDAEATQKLLAIALSRPCEPLTAREADAVAAIGQWQMSGGDLRASAYAKLARIACRGCEVPSEASPSCPPPSPA